ncbi:MAG: DUF839 domain-containing protein [Bdellovibrionales bacterium]|nr:DUF839 domain-containing protein [Bdellovibrionales bacterium]
MGNSVKRRQFLQFLGVTSALGVGSASGFLSACQNLPRNRQPQIEGIPHLRTDDLVLTKGLRYDLVAKWGDLINDKGETFGFNNDFTCFLPIEGKSNEGLLWVNHESTIPQFIHNRPTSQLTRSRAEMIEEQKSVGGSIIHIKYKGSKWQLVKGSKWNRRISGRTPIPFSQGRNIQGKNVAMGTIANCAGGLTPWKTFLTSEENYDKFYGEIRWNKGKRIFEGYPGVAWYKKFNYPPEHYGWIVEVDPWTGKAEKQVLLGRAGHEGATCVVTKSNRTVVYMGEDRKGGFIFKFVSDGLHFKSGTLYAADTKNGKWLALDIEKNPILKTQFSNQLEVLTYSHLAGKLVGATPQDRPEDIEINPYNGDILIALTNNSDNKNYYGSVIKISEKNDFDSLDFSYDTLVSGGLESGFACPDNFTFDKNGNLWMTVDIGEGDMKEPHYKMFGNNGLYYIPMGGAHAGHPIQVASAPVDAEFTGPWFSPDFKTLFLSVQHPGSRTAKNMQKPTSQWPDGPGQLPKSAVVAIQGPLLDQLMA